MTELDSGASRRLPVYLVIDTSHSMRGEPIEAVRQGVQLLVSDLQCNPLALETVWLGVITYDTTAEEAVPLSEITDFRVPALKAGGRSQLGEALRALSEAMDRDVRTAIPGVQKGDWKPLVFLMTDGHPSGAWKRLADEIRGSKRANLIGCAAGLEADEEALKRVANAVVRLKDTTPGVLGAFMKWVSASVTTASQSVMAHGDAAFRLPPVPVDEGVMIIP